MGQLTPCNKYVTYQYTQLQSSLHGLLPHRFSLLRFGDWFHRLRLNNLARHILSIALSVLRIHKIGIFEGLASVILAQIGLRGIATSRALGEDETTDSGT